ncbi:MAG: hypothetical protein E7508_10010 [Ruminococcus sp.]|nr:hypothetical protein [Ruminococcus sp.]
MKKKKFLIVIVIVLLAVILLAVIILGSRNKIKVGDIVKFGNYNWQVLEIKGGKALILSERILEQRAYNHTKTDITWANCSLREYLNGDFYDSFDDEYRKKIVSVKNKNPDNPWDFSNQGGNAATDGGDDTKDYIFLLSLDEVIEYFTDDGKDSMLYDTQLGASEMKLSDGYEKERLAYNLSGHLGNVAPSAWLLRSPGMYENAVTYIGGKGSIAVCGTFVDEVKYGIRPAMWVKKSSLELAEVECSDPECFACVNGIYTDDPKELSCVICGYKEECVQKAEHNRLYHDWKQNYNELSQEELDELISLQEEHTKVWYNIKALLEDGSSDINFDEGTYRTALVVSPDMYNRMTALLIEETSVSYDFRSMTAAERENFKTECRNNIAILNEVEKVAKDTLAQLNSSAKTFEEDGMAFLGALLYETIRSSVKYNTAEENFDLWNSGYYHHVYGEALDGVTFEEFVNMNWDGIDILFGENKLIAFTAPKEALLDNYFEAVFFIEN